MTFCDINYGAGRFRDFINATDILLLDIYPIQQFSDSSGVCMPDSQQPDSQPPRAVRRRAAFDC